MSFIYQPPHHLILPHLAQHQTQVHAFQHRLVNSTFNKFSYRSVLVFCYRDVSDNWGCTNPKHERLSLSLVSWTVKQLEFVSTTSSSLFAEYFFKSYLSICSEKTREHHVEEAISTQYSQCKKACKFLSSKFKTKWCLIEREKWMKKTYNNFDLCDIIHPFILSRQVFSHGNIVGIRIKHKS